MSSSSRSACARNQIGSRGRPTHSRIVVHGHRPSSEVSSAQLASQLLGCVLSCARLRAVDDRDEDIVDGGRVHRRRGHKSLRHAARWRGDQVAIRESDRRHRRARKMPQPVLLSITDVLDDLQRGREASSSTMSAGLATSDAFIREAHDLLADTTSLDRVGARLEASKQRAASAQASLQSRV